MPLERNHRDLISGRQRGPFAAVLRAGLTILAWVYGAALLFRAFWYRLIPGAVRRVTPPVISVGNITTGGTGKTPMTAWIAGQLIQAGRRPAILTRGYKGRSLRYEPTQPRAAQSHGRVESDEVEVLRRHCPGVEVVIDPDRVAGARRAAARGARSLVLDDGFQHRRLHRDLDIVLIDATCPFGFGRLLPRGLLREPRRALRRASVIVVTRVDQIPADAVDALVAELGRLAPDRPLLRCRHQVTGFCDVQGRPVSGVDAPATQAVIFAGIANFDSFRATVERLGVRVLAACSYADHHDYTDAEILELPQLAASLEANALLTTEKDAVKLVGRWPDEGVPLLVPRVEIVFEGDGAEVLSGLLKRTARDGE